MSVQSRAHGLVTPRDFKCAVKTCFFYLYKPWRIPAPREACSRPKEEISHIITHAIDHHGLIRGTDPQQSSRKYLASCWKFDNFSNTKGKCEKCSSLHDWSDMDFANRDHGGVALCLRCWDTFDKKDMQSHVAGPLCNYNAARPKEEKLCKLYATFCSDNEKPASLMLEAAPYATPVYNDQLKSYARKALRQAEEMLTDGTIRPPPPDPKS
ncbi:hypothetical protein FOWG_16980 [Fusarium oxysporum f. sp. lycopersici MN25]|nr:hypothetical protein FOWG_16980 [Fusarium oxysporum f. sp. lycopersici MN25]